MKTLPLSIELSGLALENTGRPVSPKSLLHEVQRILSLHVDVVGRFLGQKLPTQRQLGHGLTLREFHLEFERSSFQIQMARFAPRGEWQVQGFRFL